MFTFRTILAAAAVSLALPAFAQEGLVISDPYARVSTAMSKSGAAFMVIENHADAEDRLVGASTDAAERAELHTHRDVDGVMQMVEVEEGFAIPAGGSHVLERGGDHVMLLGLTRALHHGDRISLTLSFEKAGEVVVEVPVDLERQPVQEGGEGMHGHMPGAQPAD